MRARPRGSLSRYARSGRPLSSHVDADRASYGSASCSCRVPLLEQRWRALPSHVDAGSPPPLPPPSPAYLLIETTMPPASITQGRRPQNTSKPQAQTRQSPGLRCGSFVFRGKLPSELCRPLRGQATEAQPAVRASLDTQEVHHPRQSHGLSPGLCRSLREQSTVAYPFPDS